MLFRFEARLKTDEELAPWIERERQDEERHRKDVAALTTPKQLREVCKNLCLVSKHLRRLVGETVNSNAPRDILSPYELHELKRRARTLSLSSVCHAFLKDLEALWGDKVIIDAVMEMPSSLGILRLHFYNVDEDSN